MTRRARSGNTQKHRKMPGDATSWQELSKKTAQTNKDLQKFKSKKGFVGKNSQKKSICHFESDIEVRDPSSFKIENTANVLDETVMIQNYPKQEPNMSSVDVSKNNTKLYNPKKHKFQKEKNTITRNIDLDHEIKIEEMSVQTCHMEKLQQQPNNGGRVILPSRVEMRLNNNRKRLEGKGYPPKVISGILYRERKNAEIKFKESCEAKPCFNCRQTGHLLANCPLSSGKSSQGTGICFKCGSSEHTSHKCSKKISGYPFATCFICKQQGHLSKDCPQNKHGVYIKGGCCNNCGNVNHLRKDCPKIPKIKEEVETVVHTISEGASADAEIIEDTRTQRDRKRKKFKVVKF